MKTTSCIIMAIAMFITSAFAGLPPKQPEPPKETNTILFKGNVDLVLIKIQCSPDPQTGAPRPGKLWVEAHVGKPTRMFINSRTFLPKWQGHKTEEYTTFEAPLKPFDDAVFTVKVKRGRSFVDVSEQPSEQNDWTATIKIADQPAGPDTYILEINW